MIGKGEVRAIIPTRGNVPMDAILERLSAYDEIDYVDVVVGDTLFNRYKAALESDREIIYTQDDDCLTDIRPLLDAYEEGVIINAMTKEHLKNYKGRQTLVGFGCLFNKSLAACVMDKRWKRDKLYYSKIDRIFATINRHKTVFPKIKLLPWATEGDRLYKQRNYGDQVNAMNDRIFRVAGIKAHD